MTGRSDLDRAMTEYFEGRATNQPPDGLLDTALARVDATRQRPAWLIPNRWLPVDRSGVARLRAAVVIVVIVVAIVAGAIAAGLLVGSQRRLPPPFGLARPGLIAFDLSDGIYVANADGTGRTQLTSGPGRDSQATFSPDGTLIAYLSGGQPDLSSSLVVMGADGRHPVVLAEHLAEPGNISWSPDSRRVAIGSRLIGSPQTRSASTSPRSTILAPSSSVGRRYTGRIRAGLRTA